MQHWFLHWHNCPWAVQIQTHPEENESCALSRIFTGGRIDKLSKTKIQINKNFSKAGEFFWKSRKEVFTVTDRPGMVSMKLSLWLLMAYLVLREQTSDSKDITDTCGNRTNLSMGPVEWSEKNSRVELVYNIMKSMYDEYGEDRYKSPFKKSDILKVW